MRLLKVILATLGVSLIIALVLSLINYISASQREPDVYYYPIWTSFIFSMYYITPILLMASIIAFVSYVLFEKIKRISPAINVLLSLFIAVTITSITFYFITKSDEMNDMYLIPEGDEGDVYAFYNVGGAQ